MKFDPCRDILNLIFGSFCFKNGSTVFSFGLDQNKRGWWKYMYWRWLGQRGHRTLFSQWGKAIDNHNRRNWRIKCIFTLQKITFIVLNTFVRLSTLLVVGWLHEGIFITPKQNEMMLWRRTVIGFSKGHFCWTSDNAILSQKDI